MCGPAVDSNAAGLREWREGAPLNPRPWALLQMQVELYTDEPLSWRSMDDFVLPEPCKVPPREDPNHGRSPRLV